MKKTERLKDKGSKQFLEYKSLFSNLYLLIAQ